MIPGRILRPIGTYGLWGIPLTFNKNVGRWEARVQHATRPYSIEAAGVSMPVSFLIYVKNPRAPDSEATSTEFYSRPEPKDAGLVLGWPITSFKLDVFPYRPVTAKPGQLIQVEFTEGSCERATFIAGVVVEKDEEST